MSKVTFYGHSCVGIEKGKLSLIVDPFITGNELAPIKAKEVKAQYVLVTHGHGDHIGDAIDIALANGATIVANFELASLCASKGCKTHPMHIGGEHDFEFGRVKMTMALHGGGYGADASRYTGPATGFLITIDGRTLYHSGDTGLFYDMKLIGEMHHIDLAFLPIGDNFTMGIDDAAKAVEFLKPAKVVPMHYDTFPVIEQNPREFSSKVSAAEVLILQPGESTEL